MLTNNYDIQGNNLDTKWQLRQLRNQAIILSYLVIIEILGNNYEILNDNLYTQ